MDLHLLLHPYRRVSSEACGVAAWVAASRPAWADADLLSWPRLSCCWPCSQNSASQRHSNCENEGFWKNLQRLIVLTCFCKSHSLFSSPRWTRKESDFVLNSQILRRSCLKILTSKIHCGDFLNLARQEAALPQLSLKAYFWYCTFSVVCWRGINSLLYVIHGIWFLPSCGLSYQNVFALVVIGSVYWTKYVCMLLGWRGTSVSCVAEWGMGINGGNSERERSCMGFIFF